MTKGLNETGRSPSYNVNLTKGDSDFGVRPSVLRFNPCSGNSLIRNSCFSHRFGSISKELPGDRVFGDVRAGAVPGVQHCDLALDHLHLSSGDLHRLSVTCKNSRELSGTALMHNSVPSVTEVLVTLLFSWRQTDFRDKDSRENRRDGKEKARIFNSQGGQSPEPDS